MGEVELVDGRVSAAQCKKAVTALMNHAIKVAKQRDENELLPGKEENIWLVLSVKKVSPEKKLKPFKIPIAHPIVDPRTTPICLITKDPQREYKDLLAAQNIKFISRVVGIKKLKGKFKPYEARRMLVKENGLFLADERVVPLLPALLGKIFFDAKRQPIPVSLTKKDLKSELERAVSSTYMHQNRGSCTSVKIGTISQTESHILDNLKTALPAIVKRIEGGWENVQNFQIKTNSSISLPIWSCNLGQGDSARWPNPKAVGAEESEGWSGFGAEVETDEGVVADAGESESEDEEEEEKPKDVKKGKKRAAEGGSEKPSKKYKKAIAKEATNDISSAKKPKKKETTPSAISSKVEIASPKAKVAKKKVLPSTSKPKRSAGTEDLDAKDAKGDVVPSIPEPKAIAPPPTADSAPTKARKEKRKKDKAPSPPPGGNIVNDPPSASKSLKKDKTAKKLTPSPTRPSPKAESIPKNKEVASLPIASLARGDLKKKRAGEGMEKKKEKIAKGKIGGSTKEAIVGKKAKRRV